MPPTWPRADGGDMATEEDNERSREWARRKAEQAEPLTPEEVAAIRRILSPRVPYPGPDLAVCDEEG